MYIFAYNFRIMLTLVDNVIASAYSLFHAVIIRITSIDELYTVVVNCLQCERFQKFNELIDVVFYPFFT